MTAQTLAGLLTSDRHGATVVAWRDGAVLTLAALRADVAAAAAGLRARAVRSGLLVTDDGYWFLVGLLALVSVGADVVLPPNAQPGTVAALRETVDALITDDATADGPGVLVLASAAGGAALPLALDADTERLAFFTSGSAGPRKRIPKSLAQLEREVAVLEQVWGPALGAAAFLGTVSHQHIFGLTFRVLWPAITGRPFAARSHYAWEALLADLPDAAILVVSPAHLTRLDGLDPLPPSRRPRLVLTAGAPLPAAAAHAAERLLGTLPVEIFGSTETGAIAWRRQRLGGEPWRPLPGVTIGAAESGRLRVRSPYLPAGETYEGEDLVELDGDGFHFRGRADRTVKVEGKRVSLAGVERALLALPWVADAAVAVVTDGASFLAAAVVLSEAGAARRAELGGFRFGRLLRRLLAVELEPAALPRQWRFVAALPADSMGKRQVAAIERLLAQPATIDG